MLRCFKIVMKSLVNYNYHDELSFLDNVMHSCVYGCSTSFLTFVEIVKRSYSWYISSASSDLFCSAKYEFFNSLVEM